MRHVTSCSDFQMEKVDPLLNEEIISTHPDPDAWCSSVLQQLIHFGKDALTTLSIQTAASVYWVNQVFCAIGSKCLLHASKPRVVCHASVARLPAQIAGNTQTV
ncbi:hypothetical protein XELAEV_18018357mg [Xenopus laevis]|uniref:Uncharacterized protein n=1 Tax=Xenopus laevis TaxID=8355 RepID=A0A974DCT5_XENLA|nr:hypothetical protein XELAEV_18018357mg [Xenopus laevis]